ncbi:MAG TPA: hypothetical protein DCL35_04930 [Candidatus Omnitrophica bacterium]|nr:hypothetical protein [Candidatus Omnitrophota bacterium]
MDEKRTNVRWKIVLPVRYVGLNKHTESAARTQDISISGARLAMVERHRAGDRLGIMLDFSQVSNKPICIDADVVWQKVSCDLNEECNYLTGVVFRKISECGKRDLVQCVHESHPEEFRRHWWDGV